MLEEDNMFRGKLLKVLLFFCAVLLLCGSLSLLYADSEAPLITDDAEYAVMAAVLFHDAVNYKDEIKKPSLTDSYSRSLNGIPSSYFNLCRITTTGSLHDKGFDRTLIDDFNRKNAQPHQIDSDKLAAVTPKGSSVTLVNPKRFSMDEEPSSIRSGTTYISRPGFNKAGVEAVLNVSHVAGYEMGIGYQVILEKSPRDGKWHIVEAVVNRRY